MPVFLEIAALNILQVLILLEQYLRSKSLEQNSIQL